MALVTGGHPVGLVDDHQVPVDLFQPGEDVLTLGQVQGCNDLGALQPLVHSELIVDVGPSHYDELLVELLQEFPLPLESQVSWADDEYPLHQAAELELADEEAGHDGLAGAGIVGQQEPDAGQLHEVLVDRLQLVGQWVHAGDGEAEVWVELVGYAQGVGIQGQLQQVPVAVVGSVGVDGVQAGDVVLGEGHLAELSGVLAHQAGDHGSRAALPGGDDPHGLVEHDAGQDLPFCDFRNAVHPPMPSSCFCWGRCHAVVQREGLALQGWRPRPGKCTFDQLIDVLSYSLRQWALPPVRKDHEPLSLDDRNGFAVVTFLMLATVFGTLA